MTDDTRTRTQKLVDAISWIKDVSEHSSDAPKADSEIQGLLDILEEESSEAADTARTLLRIWPPTEEEVGKS